MEKKKKKKTPYVTQTTKLTKGEIQKLYQHIYLKICICSYKSNYKNNDRLR